MVMRLPRQRSVEGESTHPLRGSVVGDLDGAAVDLQRRLGKRGKPQAAVADLEAQRRGTDVAGRRKLKRRIALDRHVEGLQQAQLRHGRGETARVQIADRGLEGERAVALRFIGLERELPGLPARLDVARPEMTLRARPCISATTSEGTRHSVDLPAYSKTTVALRRPTSFKKELAPMRWRARADISVTMRARSMRFKGPGTDSGAAPGALTLLGLGEDPANSAARRAAV